MLAKAIAKYVRMSPRKARYVIDPLRHRSVAEALGLLATMNRRASKPVAKVIASAFANARQRDPALGKEQVVISRLIADGGPVWKRFRPAAFGRAVQIRKGTTHLTVELERSQTPPSTRRVAVSRRALKAGRVTGSARKES